MVIHDTIRDLVRDDCFHRASDCVLIGGLLVAMRLRHKYHPNLIGALIGAMLCFLLLEAIAGADLTHAVIADGMSVASRHRLWRCVSTLRAENPHARIAQPHAQFLLSRRFIKRRDSRMNDSMIGSSCCSASSRVMRGARGRPNASATASKYSPIFSDVSSDAWITRAGRPCVTDAHEDGREVVGMNVVRVDVVGVDQAPACPFPAARAAAGCRRKCPESARCWRATAPRAVARAQLPFGRHAAFGARIGRLHGARLVDPARRRNRRRRPSCSRRRAARAGADAAVQRTRRVQYRLFQIPPTRHGMRAQPAAQPPDRRHRAARGTQRADARRALSVASNARVRRSSSPVFCGGARCSTVGARPASRLRLRRASRSPTSGVDARGAQFGARARRGSSARRHARAAAARARSACRHRRSRRSARAAGVRFRVAFMVDAL